MNSNCFCYLSFFCIKKYLMFFLLRMCKNYNMILYKILNINILYIMFRYFKWWFIYDDVFMVVMIVIEYRRVFVND